MRATEMAELRAFVAVAQERSFRRAAERLRLTPSTLSHCLRALEDRLGVQLLLRTTRTVAPSEAGAALLAEIAPAFEMLDSAVERVNAFRTRPHGTLRLNVPQWAATLVLGPRLGRFAEAYPDVAVEIVVDNGFVDIVREGFDAGIRMGESVEQDMTAVPLTADLRVAVVASPAYWATHPPPQRPHDLQRHRCINRRHTARGPLFRWDFEKDGKRMNLLPEGVLTVSTEDLVMTAALDGVGVAYLAEIDAVAHLASGRLVRVLEDWCPPGPGLFLYFPRSRQSTPTLRALIEVLTAPPLPGQP